MTATVVIKAVQFDDLVERDVREQCTLAEREILLAQKDKWRQSLLYLKRKTEMQFTICKVRRFAAHSQWLEIQLDDTLTDVELDTHRRNYLKEIQIQLEWRHKANFFLSKLEQRLQETRS